MIKRRAAERATRQARTDAAAALVLVLGNLLGLGTLAAVVHAGVSEHSNAMADADPADPPALS